MSHHIESLTVDTLDDAARNARVTEQAVTLVVDTTHHVVTVLPSGRITVRHA
jgi:hypothetical protein